MSDVVDAVEDLAEDTFEFFEDSLEAVWDDIVVPIVEGVLAVFGIEDETIVNVAHISTAIYQDNVEDPVKAAITRAIFEKIAIDDTFFPAYMRQIWRVKGQVRAYYRYAEQGLYIHGLPEFEVTGTDIDFAVVLAALDTDLGTANTILAAYSQFPNPELYYKYDLQSTHTYLPSVNTLTKNDQWGANWSDWVLLVNEITYDMGLDTYNLNVSRVSEDTRFWIEGPNQVTEGDTATFTIRANRTVPVGETVTINFAYSGTAIDGSDYTQIASVVMLASTDNIDVAIVTAEKDIQPITGSTSISFSTAGILNHIGGINVVSVITFTPTSSLAGSILNAAGTASIAFSPQGVLRHFFPSNADEITGTIQAQFSLTGVLTGDLPGTKFVIIVDSITNTNAAFESVSIHTLNQITCFITDDNSLVLTMNDVIVDEGAGTATVVVKLEEAAPSGPFKVDYNFTDITATGISGGVGGDYDNDTGTLNFAGTVGETQNIVIPITSDVADDDYERFEVFLENSDDVDSIDTSRVATVTIIDGTAAPNPSNRIVKETIVKANYTRERSMVVEYHLTADPATDWFYWIYEFSAGTYPGLEPEMSVITGLEVLPVAILRKNKINVDQNKTIPLYITTRVLLQRLGFNIDDMLEALVSNPDIDDIADAYINFSLGPNSVNRIVSKMLYLQWYELTVVNSLLSNTNEYKATFKEGDVNNAVVWTDHTYAAAVVGVKTTEGEYLHEIEQYTESKPSGETSPETGDPINPIITDRSYLKIWYQATATEYDELVIFDLNGFTSIDYGSYHQVSLNKLGDDDFTIPIVWFAFDLLTAEEQLEIYQHVLRFDIYAIQVVHLEWYETGAFAQLFEFVLVVFFVISLGSATSFLVFIQNLAVNYAIGELIIWVAEVTGSEELAALVGIVAAYYFSDTSFFGEEGLPSAEQILQLSTDYADNLALAHTVEAEQIADDIEELEEEAEARENETVEEQAITPEFLAHIQSVRSERRPAIIGMTDYDQIYDYRAIYEQHTSQYEPIQ